MKLHAFAVILRAKIKPFDFKHSTFGRFQIPSFIQ